MPDNVHRSSNRLFFTATAVGALAYLHGLCVAICEELAHQGLAKFLYAVALGLLGVTLLLVAAGALQRGPEREFATALLKHRSTLDLNRLGSSPADAPEVLAKAELRNFVPDFWSD